MEIPLFYYFFGIIIPAFLFANMSVLLRGMVFIYYNRIAIYYSIYFQCDFQGIFTYI